MSDLLTDLAHGFRRHKSLADRAMVQLNDEEFFQRPAGHVNSVAVIVKHLAGNLVSRWTDFLTTDGEKPSRDRDGEFLLTEQDTRADLLAAWERGWKTLLDTVQSLRDVDRDHVVSTAARARQPGRRCCAGCHTSPITPGRSSTWFACCGRTAPG